MRDFRAQRAFDPVMGELVQLQGGRARRDVPWKSKREVAAHFSVHPGTIDRWMKKGLPYEKRFEGGVVRFVIADCDAWFRRR